MSSADEVKTLAEARALMLPKGRELPGQIINIAFALCIAGMMLTMCAAFCVKFWRWAV